ncbi:glycosyltransferase [Modestobacter versicolor]|uniref:glycosyltransferase n=1 Tax=Modestobacter versicolor TaxID=429133 RepID=UPI0034E023ED
MSYVCGLVLLHLLAPSAFTVFAGAQALLTVVGTASAALVPLPLSRALREPGLSAAQRGELVAGSIVTSLRLGTATAVVVSAVACTFLPVEGALATGLATLGFFAVAPLWGLLQGRGRIRTFVVLTLLEAAVRVVASAAAVGLGLGSTGAVLGWVVGSLVVTVVGFASQRGDLGLTQRSVRRRLARRDLAAVASIQVLISLLAVVDVLLVSVLGPGTGEGAVYQLLSTISRAPVYVATATVVVHYPRIRSAAHARDEVLPTALAEYCRLAVPAAIVVAGLPPAVIALVSPGEVELPALTTVLLGLTGLAWGALAVVAFIELASRSRRRAVLHLLVTLVLTVASTIVGWGLAGFTGVAAGTAAVSVAAVGPSVIRSSTGTARRTRLAVTATLLTAAAVVVARTSVVAWIVVGGALAVLVVRRMLPVPAAVTSAPESRPRVAHFAFEDPRMPGAGGGATRTWEVSRRLADQFDITLYCQRWPGCTPRSEEGVRFVHIGLGRGRTKFTRWLGYTLSLPVTARRVSADLVIEDFFAPFSSLGLPRYTRHPTLALVQWLNAKDKQRRYHLPLAAVERAGVAAHSQAIAVSQGIADELRARNGSLLTTVIPNGVDSAAYRVARPGLGHDVLFVGRFDMEHKGLDLLVRAWAAARGATGARLLLAGDGPDAGRVRSEVISLGLQDHVRFLGWLSGDDKYRAMAAARLVVMPSRYETFGMVAIEALACGTPVVAFDIPCLREVLPPEVSRTVPEMTASALAQALVDSYGDDELAAAAAEHGPGHARAYGWDGIAAQQARAYLTAMRGSRG